MNKKGVTLLELMLVLAIIAIGALLAIPSLGPWVANYRLRTATRDITSTLRVAQMRAVSSNLNYQVSFDVAARTYILQRSTAGVWVDEGTAQTLPTGIRIDNPAPSNNPLIFSPNSSSNGGTVTLKNIKNSERRITVVPTTGRISIQ